MTPERWERLKALFEGALERPSDTRSVWLAREAADESLAIEAARLVAAHETAGDFLEQPVSVDPADLADADALQPGAVLGGYVIEHELGRGGMGIVYAARDPRLGRRVALKVLPPLLDGNPDQQERLRREARVAANVSHPAVATVYALEEIDDGRLFIASELVEGRTLRSELERGALTRARALGIAADIARALSAAHDVGVVHRDLKPENVLLTPTGNVKVVDFGIARDDTAAARLTQAGMAMGTPAYMAPEQLAGSADARTDIYALGIVLAEMLTGAHPLSSGRPGEGVPASEVAARCMEPDPQRRYQSAREALAAIEGELAGTTRGQGGAVRSTPRKWWEFHQAATAIVYALMTWPAWIAQGIIGGTPGHVVFVAVLAAAIVTATLRLHLWFVSHFYPAEFRWARGRASAWITGADWLFAGALVGGGVLVGDAHAALALVLLAVGIGAAVAFLIIEPATTRAAFGDR